VWSQIDHSLLNDLPTSDHAAAAERLAGITRLIRRICLLREQGKTADANRLQAGELTALVAEFRLWHGPENLTEEKICALFMHETDLIREAMVIAEIMAPQLARLLPLAQAKPDAPVFPSVPEERAAARPVPDGPPAISDLLDAMLAAERPGRRLPSANQRQS
jgi:hypothetical protein